MTVSAHRPARSEGEGCRAVPMERLGAILEDFPLIINTVPAMLLDEPKLKTVRKDALVLDLASKPGGDDAGDTSERKKKRRDVTA